MVMSTANGATKITFRMVCSLAAEHIAPGPALRSIANRAARIRPVAKWTPERKALWRRRTLQGAGIFLLVGGLLAAWLIAPYWDVVSQFSQTPTRQPSRLYGRNPVLRKGQQIDAARLAKLLEEKGYEQHAGEGKMRRGFWRDAGNGWIELERKRFPSPRGQAGGDLVRIGIRENTITALQSEGRAIPEVYLDPPLVASYLGNDLRERWPVSIDDLPEHLIWSVLAAEDTNFLQHAGVSVLGIARAAWANFAAGEVKQGGSTLTQQLVKNIYLTHERTAKRKLREALLALLIDWRYEKREILEAYLNEIYWGRSGSANLMGVGAASRAYFAKDPSQLTLPEAAMLAGMIQSPANLSPLSHPEAAKKRRDAILIRLAELRWITTSQAEAAIREPVQPSRERKPLRKTSYFGDYALAEVRSRFGIQSLDDAGYQLLSTLDPDDQEAAEAAVAAGLAQLEKGPEKGRGKSPLQVALVSLDPTDGGILAYVGGRDYSKTQFDRLSQARRQAGSVFKPIVYAAAFERKVAHPSTFLEDQPFTVNLPSGPWTPQNNDDEYGEFGDFVSARTALEKSLNVPTARLAVSMGIKHVVELARRLGIASQLEAYPALALGAMEVTPLEMAGVYATLAAGGIRRQPHALVVVYDRLGQPVKGQALPQPARALGADVAFLVTKVLQGVVDRGTAASLRSEQGLKDPIAGKTGTTNSRRDSWFVGYSPERATLVWVGYDDNSKTRLSGSKAAVPIFGNFAKAVRPSRGWSDFKMPQGVRVEAIDPRTGGLAGERCSERQNEYFLDDYIPEAMCADDRGWGRDRGDEKDHPFRRWLEMLKGKVGG
jgi:penicillin-binding protein 1B